MGYLAPGPSPETFVPLNLIGHPLGDAGTRSHAESVLGDRGLISLANYWWCLAPQRFPETGLDLRAVQPEWEWRRIVIVELDATQASVRPALPYDDEETALAVVTLPADDVLRVGPPHRD